MKVSLDIPEKVYHVLQVEAAIGKVSVEQQCVDLLKEMIEVHLDNDCYFQEWIQEIYKSEKEATTPNEEQVKQ